MLLPELGELGQQRVLSASVHAPQSADAGALAVARLYLERAGLRVVAESPAAVLALPTTEQLARVAGDSALLEAARALTGAFAAVEALRQAAEFGGSVPSEIPTLSVLAEEA
jgi:hypothetical protein